MIISSLPVVPILLLPKLVGPELSKPFKYFITPVLANIYIFGMEGWLANKLTGFKVKQD